MKNNSKFTTIEIYAMVFGGLITIFLIIMLFRDKEQIISSKDAYETSHIALESLIPEEGQILTAGSRVPFDYTISYFFKGNPQQKEIFCMMTQPSTVEEDLPPLAISRYKPETNQGKFRCKGEFFVPKQGVVVFFASLRENEAEESPYVVYLEYPIQ